mgnify:CR=1 FL=1
MTVSPAPRDLTPFFAPRSIALVGASDGSAWARNVVQGVRLTGSADRAVVIDKGTDVFVGSIAKLEANADIKQRYLSV